MQLLYDYEGCFLEAQIRVKRGSDVESAFVKLAEGFTNLESPNTLFRKMERNTLK